MPWVLPSVFGCTLIWFDNIYIYLFHVVCVYIYGEISAIVLSLTKRRRSLQLLRWSSVKGFSVLIVPTLPTRRVLHFTGVNWMRLSVFCESGFCLIRCWMGVLFHLLPWFPSALYRTSSMPALLSLSLSWPGCHGGQVLHAAGSAQAAAGHMLHYFALPVHLCILSRFAWYFPLFHALNENADECMQTHRLKILQLA